jgi:hypothetical protein
VGLDAIGRGVYADIHAWLVAKTSNAGIVIHATATREVWEAPLEMHIRYATCLINPTWDIFHCTFQIGVHYTACSLAYHSKLTDRSMKLNAVSTTARAHNVRSMMIIMSRPFSNYLQRPVVAAGNLAYLRRKGLAQKAALLA